MDEKQVNPYDVMCVIKHEGKEVGRIAASAPNASDYIDRLVSRYGHLTVDYEQNPTEAMVSRLFRAPTK